MLVYTSIYALLALMGVLISQRRLEIGVLTLTLLFIVLFMGTRYYVGCDYGGYLVRFENVPRYESIWAAFGNNEPGFALITYAVALSGLDYMWLNLISSAIMVACWWYFLRHHERPLMILALLFPIIIMQLGMSGMRQGIAVSMLMVASVPFMRGERLKTAIWIVIGAQFHNSSYMLLPLAALAGTQVTFGRMTWAAMALTPVAFWLLGNRLEVYEDRYVAEIYGDQSAGGAVFRYLIMLPGTVLFFLNMKCMEKAFPRQFELLKIMSLGVVAIAPLVVLSTFALHRINFYLLPFAILTLVYVSRVIFNKRDAPIGLLIPPAIFGIYTIGWQSLSGHFQSCYNPYQSVLF